MFGIKVVDLNSKKEIENNSIINTLIKNKKLSVGAYCENLIQKNDYESAKGRSPAFEGSAQTQPLHIYGDYDLKLSNGEEYILFINICDIDDNHQENKGLFQLSLLTFSDEEIPEGFRRNTTVDDYGIFVYTLEEAQNQ